MADEVDEEATPEEPGAPEGRKPKKERVLHTRVPAVLEQELKNLAASWRMPVSNVVRAILEDALDTVDAVGRKAEGELRGVAQRLADERERLRGPLRARPSSGEPASGATEVGAHPEGTEAADASEVEQTGSWDRSVIEGALGFTALVLANPTTCPVTGERMYAGDQAFLVMFAEPGRHAIVSPRVVAHT